MQLQPCKQRRHIRHLRELCSLCGLVVGEEIDACFGDSACQHVTTIWHTIEADRAEHHCVWFDATSLFGLLVPTIPLSERIGREIGEVETGCLVLHSAIAHRLVHAMAITLPG